MAKDIIEELLLKYNITDEHTVNVVQKIIELGFDAKWLRNMNVIKDFDALYLVNTPIMRIYTILGMKYKVNSDYIRLIVSNRKLYEL
jgi:hypothetical protein